jgi:hypothetical protein
MSDYQEEPDYCDICGDDSHETSHCDLGVCSECIQPIGNCDADDHETEEVSAQELYGLELHDFLRRVSETEWS